MAHQTDMIGKNKLRSELCGSPPRRFASGSLPREAAQLQRPGWSRATLSTGEGRSAGCGADRIGRAGVPVKEVIGSLWMGKRRKHVWALKRKGPLR